MENNIQVMLPLFEGDYTKKEIESCADWIVNTILEEGLSLSLIQRIAATEHLIKSIKATKRFTDYVCEELAKYKGKAELNGTKIETAEVGSKYDFSQCNDPELTESEDHLIFYEKEVKDRRDFLKTVPAIGLDIITKDGEAIKIYPPSKTSTSSYKVTLAK